MFQFKLVCWSYLYPGLVKAGLGGNPCFHTVVCVGGFPGAVRNYKGRGPHLLKMLMLIWHRSWTPVFLGLHHKGQDGYGESLGFAIN